MITNRSEIGRNKALATSPSHDPQVLTFRLLKRGASSAFLVQVGGAGLGLVSHLVLARLLGASEYGVYTLSLTWVSVLAVLAIFGQNSSVVRFIPRYVHLQQWAELRGLRMRVRVWVFVASVLVALLLALVVLLFRSRIHASLASTLWMACLLLPALTQLHLSGALHRGMKRAASSGFFNNMLRPVLVLGLVAVVYSSLGNQLTAAVTMGISLCAVLIAWAFSEGILARAWPASAKRVEAKYETRAWMMLGGKLFFLAAIGIVLNRVDVLILGGLMGADKVGPYYAAIQLAALAVYGLNAVNTILAPMIAEKYTQKDHVGLGGLVHRAAWMTFLVTLAVSLVIVVLGRWLLSLFDPDFIVAYVPLLIVLAGQCFNAAIGPVGYILTMTRYERPAAFFFGGGACINLILSLILIPSFGLIGAAIATAASTGAWNLAAFLFVRRRLGINPTIFPLKSHETA